MKAMDWQERGIAKNLAKMTSNYDKKSESFNGIKQYANGAEDFESKDKMT